ncbi:hypothetical protein BraRD5C2_12300 [Bradyrhizobium sp. RD5-C2]|nr:hypothetical protein BraRD5C2_12300 [Bradyrhizobium sp. RD5-C2]
MVARDVQNGPRWRDRQNREQQSDKGRDAHGMFETEGKTSPGGPDRKSLAGLCWQSVKHPQKGKIWRPVTDFPQLFGRIPG